MEKATRFTSADWDAFAGAVQFSDGSEPFIAYRVYGTHGPNTVTLVANQGSVEAYVINEEDDEERNSWYRLDAPLSPLASEALLNALPEILSHDILLEWGFHFVSMV